MIKVRIPRILTITLVALSACFSAFGDITQTWMAIFDGTTQNGQTYPVDAFLSTPAVGADGTIYIAGALADPANGQRRLYAINPNTGTILSGWPVSLGTRVSSAQKLAKDRGCDSSPVIGLDGKVYVGSWNYNFYKIDPATHSIVATWTPTGAQPKGVLRNTPIVANGYVYCWFSGDPLMAATSQLPHLVILNAADLSFKGSWQVTAGNYGDAISSPALGRDGRIWALEHYIGLPNGGTPDHYGHVYNIDVSNPASPQLVWEYPNGCVGAFVSSPVIAADGRVYLGTQQGFMDGVFHGGQFITFNPSLSQPWIPESVQSTGGQKPVDGTPAIGPDGVIYVAEDGDLGPSTIKALDPASINNDGTLGEKWHKDWSFPNKYDSSPLIGPNGTVYAKIVQGTSFGGAVRSRAMLQTLVFDPSDGSVTPTTSGIDNETLAWHEDPLLNDGGGISAAFSSPVLTPNGKLIVATAGNEGVSGSDYVPTGGGEIRYYDTGDTGYVFWPTYRANQFGTGNVQDNKWTTNSIFTATSVPMSGYPYTGGSANGVNNFGKAVGYLPWTDGTNWHVYGMRWATTSSSPTMLLSPSYPNRSFQAYSVNDLGQAVGIQNMSIEDHACYWPTLSTTAVDLLNPSGFSISHAYFICQNGMIVGDGYHPTNLKYHAVRWGASDQNGTDLGTYDPTTPSLQSYAYGANIRGWTVGKSQSIKNGPFHAFAILPTSFSIGSADDPTGGATYQSEAHGINGLGQIVGGSSASGSEHAIIWFNRNGVWTTKDLGTLPGAVTSRALAINNRGQVVGWSFFSSGTTKAFIWIPGWTAIRELKSLLASGDQAMWQNLTAAVAISEDGTVAGYGSTGFGGYQSGFAIRPNP